MTSTLYRHGAVYSTAEPFAEALVVVDGVVAWLGSDAAADGLLDSVDEVVDLEAALVTPAFVDAHVHLLETGLALRGIDLTPRAGVRSVSDALDAVARAAAENPGAPILGHGWDETEWPEGRPPTRQELDVAGGGAAVYLSRSDVHSAVVSTALAERSDLRSLSGWSDTGRVERDAHHAARDATRALPLLQREELYRVALAEAAAHGIASVHEMSAPHVDTRGGLEMLLELSASAQSRLPHVVGFRGELVEDADAARALLAEIPGLTGIGGDLDIDGSVGSRTAALREPYSDVPAGAEPSDGNLYLSAEQIAAHVVAVSRAGAVPAFHVIGDRAMDELLLGLRAAANIIGLPELRAVGVRIEHASMIDAPTLASLVLHGVTISMQPGFDAAWGGEGGMYAVRLGAGRAAALHAIADMVTAGIPVAFGSDAPVTPMNAWAAVRAAVFHHEEHQRVSARAAFRAHTRGGWRLARLDAGGAGELGIGAPATLAIWAAGELVVQSPDGRISAWSTDPRAGTPQLPLIGPDAPDPVCRRTLRDGLILHDAW